jgi:Domain of unknown function (DUF6089)
MISIKNKNKMAILALFCLFFGKINAQYLEAGMFVGGANYQGDLAEKYHPNDWNTSYGLSLRYFFSPKFVWKTGFMNGQITGNDLNFRASDPRHDRNLSFRTQLLEFSTQIEYSLLKFAPLEGKNSTPYLFAGIGGLYFNPQAEYKGVWHDLQPIGTEGQGWTAGRKKYTRIAAVVPFGFGFRFSVSRRVNLGLEFGYRYAFTDYLDDVSKNYGDVLKLAETDLVAARLSYRTPELFKEPISQPTSLQRGDPSKKDNYLMAGLTVTFNLTDHYGLEWDKKYRIHDKDIANFKAKKGRKWWQRKRTISMPPQSE